jgi:hypothetical protein
VIAAVTIVGAAPSDDANPSSRSAGRLGTLAMFTWLQRLGLRVARLSGTFELSRTDVLVEYDPFINFSPNDMQLLKRFLKGGGDVLMAFGPEGIASAQPVLQSLGIAFAGTTGGGFATPAQPFDIADHVHRIPTIGGFSFVPTPTLVPLFMEGGAEIGAAQSQPDGGRVIVLGNTQALSNDGLRHADSAFFLLSVLERARGGRVSFDEYHHGEGGAVNTGAAAIFNGPIGVAAVLAACLVVAYLALNGRRLGRAADTSAQAAPSTTAYIDAMADLLARSRGRGAIALRYAEELKRTLSSCTGVDARLGDDEFLRRLGDIDADRTRGVATVLGRARALASGQPEDSALLQLARQVDDVEREWQAVEAAFA